MKQVGRELGVRYVLEGGLRKSGNRIRVTAQLVEAETSKCVWAERYDRDLADIFVVQDEITQAVTIAVAPAIADAELHRAMRKPRENLDAWAAYQRGLWHFEKVSRDDNALAEKFFRQAVDLDPNFADAHSGLAAAELSRAIRFPGSLADAQKSGESHARLAVEPSGLDLAQRLLNIATGHYFLHAYEDAIEALNQLIRSSPEFPLPYRWLAAALGQLGRTEEASAALEKAMTIAPESFDMFVHGRVPWFRPEDHAHMLKGLRKAGWQET